MMVVGVGVQYSVRHSTNWMTNCKKRENIASAMIQIVVLERERGGGLTVIKQKRKGKEG